MDKTDFLWKVIQRYDTYIGTTNTKAAFLIAWNTFLLGVLSVRTPDIVAYLSVLSWGPTVIWICLGAGTLFSLLSLWFTFWVVKPFLKSPRKAMEYQSVIFFGDVSSYSEGQYEKTIAALDVDGAIRDLRTQAHTLAKGVKAKFDRLNIAIALVMYGQIPVVVALVIVVLYRRWMNP